MGVLLVIAMLTYMKETEIARFLVQIDGTEGCSRVESVKKAIRDIYARRGEAIPDDAQIVLANDTSMTACVSGQLHEDDEIEKGVKAFAADWAAAGEVWYESVESGVAGYAYNADGTPDGSRPIPPQITANDKIVSFMTAANAANGNVNVVRVGDEGVAGAEIYPAEAVAGSLISEGVKLADGTTIKAHATVSAETDALFSRVLVWWCVFEGGAKGFVVIERDELLKVWFGDADIFCLALLYALLDDSSNKSARTLVKVLKYRVFPDIRELDNVGTKLAAFVKALRAEFVKQNGSYAENGDGEFAAGYLAGFLKDILDDASPTTWAPHHSSHNKQILDFLKDDLTSVQEETLWRRAKLYNTFAKLQE